MQGVKSTSADWKKWRLLFWFLSETHMAKALIKNSEPDLEALVKGELKPWNEILVLIKFWIELDLIWLFNPTVQPVKLF